MKQKAKTLLGLLAGLLLTVGVILISVLLPAMDENRLATALQANVDPALEVSAEDMAQFASETVWYLGGWAEEWSPEVTVNGAKLAIPATFSAHMAEVRGAVGVAKGLSLFGLIGGLALVGYLWLKGGAFPLGGYLAGAAIPFAPALVACAWAALDFNGFWGWLHYALIPGGIFDATEPVMQLFPLGLFGAYLTPVGLWLLCGLAAVTAMGIVARKDQRKKESA